jgi:hypothetical protein
VTGAEFGSTPLAEAIEALLFLTSWALVPSIVGWWVLTRNIVLRPQRSGRTPIARRPSFFRFAPIAPLASASALLLGAATLFSPLEVHMFLGHAFVGLLSLGFWGLIATVLSLFLSLINCVTQPSTDRRACP